MAKYKSNRGINFKHFFVVLGSIVTVLALFVFISASQQKTNTQSDAAGGCIMTPKVKYVSSEPYYDYGVNYTLRVWNDSRKGCNQILKYVSKHNQPEGFQMQYKNHVDEGFGGSYFFFGNLSPQEKHTVRLEVIVDDSIKNGTYSLPVRVCRTYPVGCNQAWCGDDGTELGERYRIGATENCSKITIPYIKS